MRSKRILRMSALIAASILTAVVFTSLAYSLAGADKPPKTPKVPKATAALVVPVQAAVCPVDVAVIVEPPEVPVVNSVALVTVSDTEVIAVFTDLIPGTRYAFTFTIYGDYDSSLPFNKDTNNPYPIWVGGSDGTSVRANGTYTIRMDIADMVNWRPNLNRVVMSLRPFRSDVDAVSNNAAGDPLTITQSFVV